MALPIAVDKNQIAEFCKRHHIAKLSFFGSVLTDRFNDDSDVDVLVEFDPEHIPGLIAFAGMEIELSEMLGRKVDLKTQGFLSERIRAKVLRSESIQYVA